ncbi:hypothetical protein, partial [Amycolatopsis roodepoortensis]
MGVTSGMSLAAAREDQAGSNQALRACRDRLGWSLDRAARELHRIGLEAGIPVPTDAESVRRTLIRHEAGDSAPKRTDDPYARLYSLAYRRPAHELFGSLRPAVSLDGTFAVTAHQFVPVHVGPNVRQLVDELGAEECFVGWASAHRVELVLDGDRPVRGDLYVFAWGVAVLHAKTSHRPESIAELAVWRRETHRSTRERLARHLASVLQHGEQPTRYVLTAFWLDEPAWSARDLHTAMRLMTSPRVLLGSGSADLHQARQIEKRLFSEGFAPDDHVPVGIDGVSLGWASWAGVSYHPLATTAALCETDLVTVELLAQGLWCLCDDLDQQVRAGKDPVLPEGHDWRWL